MKSWSQTQGVHDASAVAKLAPSDKSSADVSLPHHGKRSKKSRAGTVNPSKK
jgi:hypothetical protein